MAPVRMKFRNCVASLTGAGAGGGAAGGAVGAAGGAVGAGAGLTGVAAAAGLGAAVGALGRGAGALGAGMRGGWPLAARNKSCAAGGRVLMRSCKVVSISSGVGSRTAPLLPERRSPSSSVLARSRAR
jgi:hypothetical protein